MINWHSVKVQNFRICTFHSFIACVALKSVSLLLLFYCRGNSIKFSFRNMYKLPKDSCTHLSITKIDYFPIQHCERFCVMIKWYLKQNHGYWFLNPKLAIWEKKLIMKHSIFPHCQLLPFCTWAGKCPRFHYKSPSQFITQPGNRHWDRNSRCVDSTWVLYFF